MTNEKVKRMLDACYQAKRIRELLPPLPQGVMPSYIQYMDTIQKLEKQGIQVKVSDISDVMNLPRPGVTRTVKEMKQRDIFTSLHLRRMDVSHTYPSLTREENYHRNMIGIISASWLFLSVIFLRKTRIV